MNVTCCYWLLLAVTGCPNFRISEQQQPKPGVKKAAGGGKKYDLMQKKSSGDVPTVTGTASGGRDKGGDDDISGGFRNSAGGFRKSSSGYSHLGCCSAVPYNLAEEPDHLGDNLSRTPAKMAASSSRPCVVPVRLADPTDGYCYKNLINSEGEDRQQPPTSLISNQSGTISDERNVSLQGDTSPMSEQSGYVTNDSSNKNSSESSVASSLSTPSSSEEDAAAGRPDVAAERPDVAAERPDVAAERPDVAAERPDVATGQTGRHSGTTFNDNKKKPLEQVVKKNGLSQIKSEDECEDDGGDCYGDNKHAEDSWRGSCAPQQQQSAQLLQSPSLLLQDRRTQRARSEEPPVSAQRANSFGTTRRTRFTSDSAVNCHSASSGCGLVSPLKESEAKAKVLGTGRNSILPPREFRDMSLSSGRTFGRQAADSSDHLRHYSLEWFRKIYST